MPKLSRNPEFAHQTALLAASLALPDEIVDKLPSPIDRSSRIQRTLDSWNDASGGGGGGGGAAASTMPLPSLSFRMNDPLLNGKGTACEEYLRGYASMHPGPFDEHSQRRLVKWLWAGRCGIDPDDADAKAPAMPPAWSERLLNKRYFNDDKGRMDTRTGGL